VTVYRTATANSRQEGSALFSLDRSQGVEHDLDHAVVLERAESDDLRRSRDHNPGDRGGEDCFEVHENR